MLDIFSNFTLPQIILCAGGLILAVKGAWDLVDYFKNKYNEKFNKDYSAIEKQKTLEEHYKHCIDQHQESVNMYSSLGEKIDNLTETVNERFDELENRVDQLTESDKDDIRQSIVRDYHYFTEQKGWIDDFSLDCLERRFKHYKAEGGNSYAEGLMKELRALPKTPPA